MPSPAVTLAVPLVSPKQSTLVELQVAVTADGVPTTDVQVDVHPFASVTVTVYVPAVNPLMEVVTAEVLHK